MGTDEETPIYLSAARNGFAFAVLSMKLTKVIFPAHTGFFTIFTVNTKEENQ